MAKKLKKVIATTDSDGHWYVIPKDLYGSFLEDNDNEDMVAYGDFENKWGRYRTGGDLNIIQLYAEI